MGFERMCTVLQQKESVFDTDIFRPIIDAIQKYI
jgi:alanyl-tRNA synthetase